jgi:hypothetical protein
MILNIKIFFLTLSQRDSEIQEMAQEIFDLTEDITRQLDAVEAVKLKEMYLDSLGGENNLFRIGGIINNLAEIVEGESPLEAAKRFRQFINSEGKVSGLPLGNCMSAV